MKSTNAFKEAIKSYLDNRANEDQLFAVSYAKENKNIDDCITYILNAVKKSGCNGFEDNEIYSMAIHYYDEDDIKVGKPISCNVVVNHTVELTEEDKQQAKADAMKQLQNNHYKDLKKPKSNPKPKADQQQQTSLFDLFDEEDEAKN